MLCQNCGKNQATTHVKKTINGETSELHLCAACAAKQGLGGMWNGFGFDLGDFWGRQGAGGQRALRGLRQNLPGDRPHG